ncbi:MAG: hypothetical protein P1R58_12950 [bacterium]|nr:hypothetical protein [bacterium]
MVRPNLLGGASQSGTNKFDPATQATYRVDNRIIVSGTGPIAEDGSTASASPGGESQSGTNKFDPATQGLTVNMVTLSRAADEVK